MVEGLAAGPKKPTAEEIAWVKGRLLGRLRNVIIGTEERRMRELYSTFEELPDGTIRALWGSPPTARHSVYIDRFEGDAETAGHAPVELLLADTDSPNVYLTMQALARRLPIEQRAAALALMQTVRLRRGHPPTPIWTEVLYEARVVQATIPVPILAPDGSTTGEDHAEISLDALRGFRQE